MNLVWLRSDLRTFDNPALVAAMSEGPTIAVYCLAQKQWDEHGISLAKRSLILRQLVTLEKSLAELNVPLMVLNSGHFNDIPKQLCEFVQTHNISNVFINDEYELNERRCTEATQRALSNMNVQSTVYVDQCMIAPGTVLTKQGEMFKVYTAFKRAFMSEFPAQSRDLLGRPKPQTKSKNLPASNLEVLTPLLNGLDQQQDHSELWPAGEHYALEQLDDFVEEKAKDYADHRDFPNIQGTSTLSPYLAIGAISTTQCVNAALNHSGRSVNGGMTDGKDGISVWINELIWREFYRHFIFAYPELCMYKPFKAETDALPWKNDSDLFDAWKQGQTGYPIVDAAMRQLNETGWMHNRLRMVVAMFFTKHLFLDWRLGEAYFMSQLVDGDFASNNGGWQWSASTGVDAAPYFRIFNPVRQSERFDESGAFIKRYVPELASLSPKEIHMPKPEKAKALGYPQAIVNHSIAVKETKQHFKNLSLPMDEQKQETLFVEAKIA